MTRAYLAGTLSAREMYAVEDRLLESDFHFEAMEGLERVPWKNCQQAVDETRQKIIDQFNIKSHTSRTTKGTLMVAAAVAVVGLGVFWLVQSSGQETIDLSPEIPADSSSPANQTDNQAEELPVVPDSIDGKNDSIHTEGGAVDQPTEVLASASGASKKPDDYHLRLQDPEAVTHVAIGRVVDTRGIGLPGVSVNIGGQIDRTNKNGYYAITVVAGITNISIEYSGFTDQRRVDTSADWEIVLDIENQKIAENYPIKGANRFK